jgi:two-component system chemotaxis response regulator CheB
MIRVLVIDDSFFVRKVLGRVLFSDGEIEVVGEASSGEEGIEKLMQLKPDVVCLDIVMPREDGSMVLEKIFNLNPTPVVVVSSVSTAVSEISKSLLQLGMLEIIQKPDSPENLSFIQQELIRKIKAASKLNRDEIGAAYRSAKKAPKADSAGKILVVGCPVSRPVQLEDFLTMLPRFMSAGIVVRLFMYTQLMDHWVNRIKQSTMFACKIAEDGDMVIPGRILFSPNDKAIEIKQLTNGGVVRLINSDKMQKDYIDTMFESAANAYRENTVAVILSEMALDGLEGLRAVKAKGGKAFLEVSDHLPAKVRDEKLADAILPLPGLAEEVSKLIATEK